MSNFDNKEYTRLRDIVVKRNKRAVEAGLMPLVHFPTIREIKAGVVSPGEAMRAVKGYYSGGSQVKAIKATGLVPEFKTFPVLPFEQIDLKERKRQQQREYRRRKKVREIATSPEQAKKFEVYLKALKTVEGKFGFNLNITPSQAQAFVEYMEYRFSQGDFTQHYVIDEFVQDFSRLLEKGYDVRTITKDFDLFLENRKQLLTNAENMEGLTPGEIGAIWDDYIEGL